MVLYFEDVEVGDTRELGSDEITRDEIVAFAERYDPQPFHVDEEAAAASPFGGLVASGWHTGSLCMRHLATGLLADAASLGARGVDELRWLAPVRPGDHLATVGEVVATRPSGSDPRRGYVDYRCVMSNGEGTEVLSFVGLLMFERRDPGGGG